MNRDELTALRDVIDALLRCPDHVRELLTQWIAPVVARSKERTVPLIFSKPNGRDPHPPPIAPMGAAANAAPDRKDASKTKGAGNGAAANAAPGSRRSPIPYAGKARPGKSPTSAAFAEQRLLTAMQEHSGASVDALAKAAGANRSSTGERLRGLAARGVVTKDAAGHWRLTADLAGEKARPMSAPPST